MTLQPTPVLFPDAELWATTTLRTALAARPEPYAAGVFVSNTVPSSRRDRMVIVRRDGGASDGLFDYPRLGMNVWATTEQDATDLARLVAALLWSAPGDGVCVAMTQQSGPSAIPDESGAKRRYSVFEATMRGEPL